MAQGLSDLPANLRRQIAALVEHGSLPALRLISRGWNEAANLAVRQLKRDPWLLPERLRLIGQRWPNLERLELDLQPALAYPDENCRDLISSLMPLMRLQHLSLVTGALLLPEGQEFMLRQTQLLSLYLGGTMGQIGASDGVLQVIGRLSHLTRLECFLQAEHNVLILPPFQLEPATDEGVRCLSSLQSLQDLTLMVQAFDASVTGQPLSSIGSLHQLTHLSLQGWPMVDTDLGHLTHLQLHSLELKTCLYLTSGCMMHLGMITHLCFLSLEDTGGFSREEREAFVKVAFEVMPILTTLKF